MRHLRMSLGFSQAKQFAAFLNVGEDRWGGVERGNPLSIQLVRLICNNVPVVTADYLLFGRAEALSPRIAGKLGMFGG